MTASLGDGTGEKPLNHWTITGMMRWTILVVALIAVLVCAFVAVLIVPFGWKGKAIVFTLPFGLGTYIGMRMTGQPTFVRSGARDEIISGHDPTGTGRR